MCCLFFELFMLQSLYVKPFTYLQKNKIKQRFGCMNHYSKIRTHLPTLSSNFYRSRNCEIYRLFLTPNHL